MRFGIFLLMPCPSGDSSEGIFARGMEIAKATEELGYHNIWLAEHHFSNYGYLSRPLMIATHIAAKTTHLRVGTAVIVLPLHHPLVVAEEIATADFLSNGRLDVGLGRGYQSYEFERFGLNLDESRPRLEEAVDILLKAFTEKSFSFQGQYYSFPETTVQPKPLQKPYPPVWVMGQSPQSFDAGVRRGFNFLTGGVISIKQIVDFRNLFDKAVAKYQPTPIPAFGVNLKAYVTDSEEEALVMAKEALWNMRVSTSLRLGTQKVEQGRALPLAIEKEPSPQELVKQRCLLYGTPDQCIQHIQQLKDEASIDHLSLEFWQGEMPHDKVLRSMERFAKDVMPHFL